MPSPLRSTFLCTALALAAAACDRTGAAPPSASSRPAASASASAATALPPAPPLPAGRCALRTSSWSSGNVHLHLSEAGGAFVESMDLGRISSAFASTDEAELSIPGGPARRFGLRITTKTLVLEGLADAAEVRVHAMKPIVLAGFAIATPVTPFKVIAVAPDAVEIEPDLGAAITLAGPALRERRPCGDLAIGEASFEPASALPAKPARRATLHGGRAIDLAAEPGAAAIAHISPEEGEAVDVLETRGPSARIAWSTGQALVFGWIPTGALGPPPRPGKRRKGEEGRMGERPNEPAPLASLACDTDIPLVAEVGAERATAGRVRAHARIDVLERAGAFSRVRVRASAVRPTEGARWMVRGADLAGCAKAEAKDGEGIFGTTDLGNAGKK